MIQFAGTCISLNPLHNTIFSRRLSIQYKNLESERSVSNANTLFNNIWNESTDKPCITLQELEKFEDGVRLQIIDLVTKNKFQEANNMINNLKIIENKDIMQQEFSEDVRKFIQGLINNSKYQEAAEMIEKCRQFGNTILSGLLNQDNYTEIVNMGKIQNMINKNEFNNANNDIKDTKKLSAGNRKIMQERFNDQAHIYIKNLINNYKYEEANTFILDAQTFYHNIAFNTFLYNSKNTYIHAMNAHKHEHVRTGKNHLRRTLTHIKH